MPIENDLMWMQRALVLAEKAAELNEVPVGAVIVRNNMVLGEGWNQPIGSCDPTGHAEIRAIRQAALHERNYRIPDTTMYVTIEPCTMCLGAIVHARIARVVFGAQEPKAGALKSNPVVAEKHFFNHFFEWEGGVRERECAEQIQAFFAHKRAKKKSLKKNPE